MKIYFTLLVSGLFIGCSAFPDLPDPINERGPQVLYAAPEMNAKISLQPRLAVIFSKPIDPTTIGPESVLLISGGGERLTANSVKELYDDIDDGQITSVLYTPEMKQEGTILVLSVDQELDAASPYTLIVTPRVLSTDRIPVSNGTEDPKAFAIFYQTIANGETPDPIQPPEIQIIIDAPPAPSVEEESPPPPPKEPEIVGTVVLNEIFYDAIDADTDGTVFIELYGTAGLLIGDFRINLVDGGDGSIDDVIAIPTGARIPDDGFYVIADLRTGTTNVTQVLNTDFVDTFDPQNGPDAVQLIDAAGQLLDAVGYGVGLVNEAQNGLSTFEGTSTIDVVNGHSLERSSPGMDTQDNTIDFIDREVPTPGL